MLASRARVVLSRQRTFATQAPIKVSSVDAPGVIGRGTAAVTLLVKAGTRYEPANKPGVAHVLKNFAFKSTKNRSAIGTVRESELYGGVLSASLSREHLALTAEFLRGDEAFFVSLLTSFLTSAKFTRHELEEYVLPVVHAETTAASSSTDPAAHAIDLAHALAFRTGLGASLFASTHAHITVDDVAKYAQSVFSLDNVAIVGSGIEQTVLADLVSKSLSSQLATGTTTSPATVYYGGETRVDSGAELQTVFIGFGAAGSAISPEALSVLSSYIDPTPSVKWSTGLSPLAIPGVSIKPVYNAYSDATFLGFVVQSETVEGVKEGGKKLVAALKEVATKAEAEKVGSAVKKATFKTATEIDAREAKIGVAGAKVLAKSETSIDSTLKALAAVDAAALSKAASALLKTKPTYVVVGNIRSLPYADELGL